MTEFFLLLLGLAGLWLGSEVLMKGAMALTDRYFLSDAAFGMVVLAVGTDLPELFVAVDASIRSLGGENLSGIVVGSAIGSSIGQFGLVFGVAGFLGFNAMRRRYLPRNAFFLIGSIVAVFLFALDGRISVLEGVLLILFYYSYLYIVIARRMESPDASREVAVDGSGKAWVLLAIGLVILFIAAEVTVVSAIGFAKVVGISNVAVSAIIIGMGSSLPELSVSFAALLKNRSSMSVGNLVGSNILDVLLVPGIAAVISPLAVPVGVLIVDLPVLLLITVLVILFFYVSRRGVQKPEALTLLVIYLGYVFIRLTGPGS